jgi:flavin reductase (DIM6/NTAB) family NADH-FMN oxidoreductase RutF
MLLLGSFLGLAAAFHSTHALMDNNNNNQKRKNNNDTKSTASNKQKKKNRNNFIKNKVLNSCVDNPHNSNLPADVSIVQVAPHLFSRLLYTNPVCFLTSIYSQINRPKNVEPSSVNQTLLSSPSNTNTFAALQEENQNQDENKCVEEERNENISSESPNSAAPLPHRNIQAISWLTAADNHGRFIASLNCHRYTAEIVREEKRFVLNVATENQIALLKAVGGCSGREGDKFLRFSIPICRPGWNNQEPDDTKDDIALTHSPAHLICQVDRIIEDIVPGHLLLSCQVISAYVRSDYWLTGKNFIPQSNSLPAYLTFLGSGNFAKVVQ